MIFQRLWRRQGRRRPSAWCAWSSPSVVVVVVVVVVSVVVVVAVVVLIEGRQQFKANS